MNKRRRFKAKSRRSLERKCARIGVTKQMLANFRRSGYAIKSPGDVKQITAGIG